MQRSIASPSWTDFLPGWRSTLTVLALLPVLIWLGFWQLSRGAEKSELLARYEARRSATPLALAELQQKLDPAYRHVRLQGHFDASHSLLLDNSIRGGQVGVELLQPFFDQTSGLWVLVNRGWLPWPDRRHPALFTTPEQVLNLTAWVYVPPGRSFQLHADPAGGSWPRLITRVEPASLWQQLGRTGLANQARLEPGPAALQIDWPVVAMGPEKHQAYAVQWFAMAAALLGLFIYLGWHTGKEKRSAARSQTDLEPAAEHPGAHPTGELP